MPLPSSCEVLVCGAGIAGVAAAHHLAARAGVRDVLLVDERAPLTLTSDKSTEAYRNFWPGPDAAMVGLMNRSLDLVEDLARAHDNVFRLNRRGYLYATASSRRAAALAAAAEVAAAQGAGPLRVHGRHDSSAYVAAAAEGFAAGAQGADLLEGHLLRRHFPYVSDRAVSGLHVRRCGWLSGQQLGMLLLEQALVHGVRLATARVVGVDTAAGGVQGVWLQADGQTHCVRTSCLVNAAGPFVTRVAALLGVSLPVFCERHLKMAFRDTRAVVPRHAPLLIWEDAQCLEWSADEREALASEPEARFLLGSLPAGVHGRPEGGVGSEQVLLLWPYHSEAVEPSFPLPEDPWFAEIALRGMVRMLPGLRVYCDSLPRAHVDGGYYVKTRENRCLVGPLPVRGAYILGALSGYGLMVACGAAELLAAHVTGATLPVYAGAFALGRYADPDYRRRLDAWGPTGEL